MGLNRIIPGCSSRQFHLRRRANSWWVLSATLLYYYDRGISGGQLGTQNWGLYRSIAWIDRTKTARPFPLHVVWSSRLRGIVADTSVSIPRTTSALSFADINGWGDAVAARSNRALEGHQLPDWPHYKDWYHNPIWYLRNNLYHGAKENLSLISIWMLSVWSLAYSHYLY